MNRSQSDSLPTAEATPQTAVVVVIDRSGSMEPLRGVVVEGANQVLADLDPADRVTFVQFDSEEPYDLIIDALPAAEVLPIAYERYEPRGGTPLYDAVGEALTRTAGWAEQSRVLTGVDPNVVFTIISDGYENASSRFSGPQVARLLEHYQEHGWTVAYIGLGNDAFAEAQRLGVRAENVSSNAYSDEGTLAAFNLVTTNTEQARRRRR
jgi:Mg-chelatase subunit ChlD